MITVKSLYDIFVAVVISVRSLKRLFVMMHTVHDLRVLSPFSVFPWKITLFSGRFEKGFFAGN